MSEYRYPLYIVSHPQDGFQEMKANNKASIKSSVIIILLWLFVELLYRTITDYDVNPFANEEISIIKVSMITVLMYVMACVANWCFCTLLDGKGKMKDIFVVGAYSLIPYIFVRLTWVLLSEVFTSQELILVDYCVILAKVWCFIICFIGLKEIHEYTVKMTIMSIFLTILGILIMMFLGMMFLTLVQQLYTMGSTVFLEIMY